MKTFAVCLMLLAALTGISCGSRHAPLPIYGQVPSFVLLSQTGEGFRSDSLDGKVWVADFIFTSCPGPCPRMTSQMRSVARATADLPDVRFVSFTVDPATDTPAVLNAFSKRYDADPKRWVFLTGPQPSLNHLSNIAFKLGKVDGSLMHSTRFVLVDQKGRIRGYYGTTEEDETVRLVNDIRKLASEQS